MEPRTQLIIVFLLPFIAIMSATVPDLQCVTKDGVIISFKKIQVVYRLQKEYVHETLLNYGVHYKKTWIHDKIYHHIIQFYTSHSFQEVYIDKFVQIGEEMKEALQVDCTRYALGIEIISVHVINPDIPDNIRDNCEQLEGERIKVLISIEKQKVAEKEAEISQKMAVSETEKNAKVSKIHMEHILLEKEGSRRQQEMENQMYLQQERAIKEAEANKLKLTPEYLELKYIEAFGEIANKTSAYNMFLFGLHQYLQRLSRFVFGLAQNMIR